jgi:hypothetical protein
VTTADQVRRDLGELDKLLESRGWAVIQEYLSADIHKAALAIGDDPRVSLADIQYLRGRLSAAKDFLHLPSHIRNSLSAQVALAKPSSAKAEQKE